MIFFDLILNQENDNKIKFSNFLIIIQVYKHSLDLQKQNQNHKKVNKMTRKYTEAKTKTHQK